MSQRLNFAALPEQHADNLASVPQHDNAIINEGLGKVVEEEEEEGCLCQAGGNLSYQIDHKNSQISVLDIKLLRLIQVVPRRRLKNGRQSEKVQT